MKSSALAAAALAGSAGLSSFAAAASVEAGTLTTVMVGAPLFDSNLGAANGCDPEGCVGDSTRDGDATSLESRWSCKPDLGAAGSICSITYDLSDELTLDALNIALYKGDTRTRTMDVLVDGQKIVTWTSSGTTAAFETVELGVTGQTIELQGVLAASEWLSIMEVEILVDDGDDSGQAIVEAGDLGIVTATSDVYDTRLAAANGCDPQGCTAALTRDGDLTEESRWSCAPSLGGKCTISYDLGGVRDLSELKMALYKGATRTRTVEVYVDGDLITTWTSSGKTNGFESIDLSGNAGEVIEISGVLADMEWLSIIETEIMVLSESPFEGTASPATTPTAAPIPTPAPAAPTTGTEQEAGDVGTVTATSDLFDTNLSTAGGCDPVGCAAGLTRDDDLTEGSRWSCAPKLGGACSISYDLGAVRDLSQLRLALYKGATRVRTVEVYVDGLLVTTWTSSGATNGFESIDLSGNAGEMIEIVGVLADSEWLSIIETEIMVFSSDGGTLPPAPTPTPAPVDPTPTGELQPVGPLPLASVGFSTRDPFNLQPAHAIKDGDMASSWSCSGDPTPDDDVFECYVTFDLFAYRQIKQVKIALANGASGPTGMSISVGFLRSVDPDLQELVTSSGTTEDFETYDFDYFTNYITIGALFTSAGQTLSIAEVEFIEEVQAGEIPVTDFDYPSSLSTGATTDALGFISDSSEVLDETLEFDLAYFTAVTSLLLQFPTGDTYTFDVMLLDKERDPIYTQEGLESADRAGWQSFDIAGGAVVATFVEIVMKGTGSGAPGFKLLDARVVGDIVENPTDTFFVGSTNLAEWGTSRYPDFVAEGTGDQKAIMGAICAVKKASFDGVDCVGGDDTATGTVGMNFGQWFVDGNIFMKSGVTIAARFTEDDFPNTTELTVEEGAEGKTDIPALIVMDGISGAAVNRMRVNGRYDPESGNGSPAVDGLGSVGVSIVDSEDITLRDTEVNFSDGDAVVVRNSKRVSIDAGPYDVEYTPWDIGQSRGTGIVVDSSDSVWVRRCHVFDNGVAGIHIMGSNNFTFEATIADECPGPSFDCPLEGEGRVGRVGGQQPIEVIVESSTLVKFQDVSFQSVNDPVMTVSDSETVSLENCGFRTVPSGNCAIQTDTLSEVATSDDPELNLVGTCYFKV